MVLCKVMEISQEEFVGVLALEVPNQMVECLKRILLLQEEEGYSLVQTRLLECRAIS